MLLANKHLQNFKRVLAKACDLGGFHMLFLCEVGGHKKGLAAAGVNPQDLLNGVLAQNAYMAAAEQAYMSVWQTSDAPELPHVQTGGLCLTQVSNAQVHALQSDITDPQLIVRTFKVTATKHRGHFAYLVVGQLHIRTPEHKKSPTTTTRKRIARYALQVMEAQRGRLTSGAAQPASSVTLVLTGDVNMPKGVCDSVVQAATDPLVDWHVQAANAGLSGDVAFVTGTHSTVIDISIGHSYEDNGLRGESHDFFGLSLSIPIAGDGAAQFAEMADEAAASQEAAERGQKRPHEGSASGAPQPAHDEGCQHASPRQRRKAPRGSPFEEGGGSPS
jgi:hypothetical protein